MTRVTSKISPTKQFVGLYFLFLAILFIFFYADTSIVSSFLNDGQTKLTLFFLDIFLAPNQLSGADIIINPYYKIIINQSCNGIIPTLFLFASVLAYPSGITHKIIWIAIGYLSFFIVNILRILLVVYFVGGEGGRENFYWSHNLLGNALLIALGLGLFVIFIKTIKKN